MRSDYGYPQCAEIGPTAPRTMIFIFAWEAAHGAHAGQCEDLVAQYHDEVNNVLAEWDGLAEVCDTLRAMRARIAARAALAEIESMK